MGTSLHSHILRRKKSLPPSWLIVSSFWPWGKTGINFVPLIVSHSVLCCFFCWMPAETVFTTQLTFIKHFKTLTICVSFLFPQDRHWSQTLPIPPSPLSPQSPSPSLHSQSTVYGRNIFFETNKTLRSYPSWIADYVAYIYHWHHHSLHIREELDWFTHLWGEYRIRKKKKKKKKKKKET